ncbi:Uroporphyrinogen decarboxylase (URO-D) [Solidesulfovibrio carbinoliphilus subsp. oakridgensis]|uniref:Uroporphyrinogen decarboxylase (URO-D) n=1 Tax=Solidesulfovibrio carbinoliphilus subsp. oakridgensis TaxID=694327 RepID=G7Q4U5_9BACT|nr:uroporphyrinogen decarboxylase family protein [Solidesulfovibrio carbinoliphilus]EHJ47555.1 Uroporphyrinogen decarboxylase (URO-D) [Solidesulfovibrio carbinoliphilus subsp. oakridgensis]
MNSLDRVFAAVRGEPADRRAFSLVLSLYGAKLTGCSLSEYYAKPEKYLAGQQAVVDLVDPDILFTPFALPLEARAFGCGLQYFDTAPPNVIRPACKGLTDLAGLLAPDPATDPGLRYLVESTRLLSREFGGKKPIAALLTAPMDLPALLVTIGEWIEALLFDPEARDGLLRRSSDHFVGLATALFEAGADFVVIPAMFTNPRLLTPQMVLDQIVPPLAEAFSRVPGPIVFHHGGNPLASHLGLFRKLPHVVGFALDHRDSFAEARDLVGEIPVLLGNLSGPHLPGLSPEEAYARTCAILSTMAADPRCIFCTSSADVPWSTPLETIEAVARAVRDTGKAKA